MKLSYWYADCLTDSRAYSVREKTKKAALATLEELKEYSTFGKLIKVEVEYHDGFDLMLSCSGEGSNYWEPYG